MSGGKVCEECAKKVAEGSDASRKYVVRVGLKLEVALAVGVYGGRAGGGVGDS